MNKKVFEYDEWFDVGFREDLQSYLENTWKSRYQQYVVNQEDPADDLKKTYQPFLNFDGNKARANNYIGFIQNKNLHLEIYPKVFRSKNLHVENPKLILRHVFFWFEYCRKWNLPFTNVNLDNFEHIDFPELIIKLMADQIFKVLSEQPLSLYTEVEESLNVPRGSINFTRYVNNNVSSGNLNLLECDHELLLFDNQFNRIIKHATRILKTKAVFNETHQQLDSILFLLDEVSDVNVNIYELDKIKINPFFSDYINIKEICQLILEQKLYSHNHDEQSFWSMLFPMEYVFEDFVAAFMEKHFSDNWKVHYQKSDMYLSTDPKVFQMQHDIFLTSKAKPDIKIIVDTKYKLRGDFKTDVKRGVAQNDLYQMTTYAYRRGCSNVLLLYPNMGDTLQEIDVFKIKSGFDSDVVINVTVAEIPFWSVNSFNELAKDLKDRLLYLLENSI